MISVKEFTDYTILKLDYDEYLEGTEEIITILRDNNYKSEVEGSIVDFSVNIKVTPKLEFDKHGNSLVTSKGNVKFIKGVWE